MKVYMPLNTLDSRNKYLYNLYKCLKDLDINLSIDKNYWLKMEGDWDIILIHWPEHLPFIKKDKIPFEKFQLDRIKYFKTRSKFISIYHNFKPHGYLNNYQKLYRDIYTNSDAIIHFSNFSIKCIKKKYTFKNCSHYVVPHGNYTNNFEPINKNLAKKRLGLSIKKNTVICIGATRNIFDYFLILSFKKIFLNNKFNFIYAGELYDWIYRLFPWKLRFSIKKITVLFSKIINKFNFNKDSLLIINKTIDDDELNILCSASDILLIAKKNNLNSGNIALGFTFSKIVLGPEIGNIGEILKSTSNPTYKLKKLNSIEIIEKCQKALVKKVGLMNNKYILEECNWNKIGNNLKMIFEMI